VGVDVVCLAPSPCWLLVTLATVARHAPPSPSGHHPGGGSPRLPV